MSDSELSRQASADLGYVRQVVEGATSPAPAGIFYLWAVIIGAAFVLADVRPHWIGQFWMVAGPVGWLASALIGGVHSRRLGQMDRRLGMRHAAHWAGMLFAMGLAVLLPLQGLMEWEALGHVSLLLLGLLYFLSGVHLDRATLWLGPWMAGAYALALYLPAWNWSVSGAAAALGLAATPLLSRMSRAPAEG